MIHWIRSGAEVAEKKVISIIVNVEENSVWKLQSNKVWNNFLFLSSSNSLAQLGRSPKRRRRIEILSFFHSFSHSPHPLYVIFFLCVERSRSVLLSGLLMGVKEAKSEEEKKEKKKNEEHKLNKWERLHHPTERVSAKGTHKILICK